MEGRPAALGARGGGGAQNTRSQRSRPSNSTGRSARRRRWPSRPWWTWVAASRSHGVGPGSCVRSRSAPRWHPDRKPRQTTIYLLAEWRHRPNVWHDKLLRSIIDQLTNKHTKGTDVPRRLPFSPARPDQPNIPQWDFCNRHGYRLPNAAGSVGNKVAIALGDLDEPRGLLHRGRTSFGMLKRMRRIRCVHPVRPPRSAFTGFRFPREVIVLAVRWYLRYGLSYRDVEELLAERGVQVDHVSIYR